MAAIQSPFQTICRRFFWFCVLLLTLNADGARLTPDNDAWNVNRETQAGVWRGEYPGYTYFPSPADWRAIPIYQVITGE